MKGLVIREKGGAAWVQTTLGFDNLARFSKLRIEPGVGDTWDIFGYVNHGDILGPCLATGFPTEKAALRHLEKALRSKVLR